MRNFKERALEQALLFLRQVALGLLLENAEHIDAWRAPRISTCGCWPASVAPPKRTIAVM